MAGRTTMLCNVTVLVDGVNLSGACNEATLNYSAEMLDVTTFGHNFGKETTVGCSICTPGTSRLCYTGPPGSEGVGSTCFEGRYS